MASASMGSLPLAKATADGTTATVRRVGARRFRLHLSYAEEPRFVRVFLAFSLSHLAQLLVRHVPAAGVREIVNAVAQAGVV